MVLKDFEKRKVPDQILISVVKAGSGYVL